MLQPDRFSAGDHLRVSHRFGWTPNLGGRDASLRQDLDDIRGLTHRGEFADDTIHLGDVLNAGVAGPESLIFAQLRPSDRMKERRSKRLRRRANRHVAVRGRINPKGRQARHGLSRALRHPAAFEKIERFGATIDVITPSIETSMCCPTPVRCD